MHNFLLLLWRVPAKRAPAELGVFMSSRSDRVATGIVVALIVICACAVALAG